MSRVTLLGPVADGVDLAAELGALEVDGPVALVTAGWEEAERNDSDLDRGLGGGTRNLGLYGRRLDVLESHPEYAVAERELRARLADLREVYLLRLHHAIAGVDAVVRRFGGARRHAGAELDDAMSGVRGLDERHANAMSALYEDFYAEHPPHTVDAIRRHREEVGTIIAGCAAVAVAGGHIGTLIACLHMCNVASFISGRPVIAWSSGAMAVAGRIIVVDDTDPARCPDELFDTGLGIAARVVLIPAATTRMNLHDRDRLALLSRRCAPDLCVLLDPGDRAVLDDGRAPDLRHARVVTPDGGLRTGAAAA